MLSASSIIESYVKNKMSRLIEHIDDEYDHWLIYEYRPRLKNTLYS